MMRRESAGGRIGEEGAEWEWEGRVNEGGGRIKGRWKKRKRALEEAVTGHIQEPFGGTWKARASVAHLAHPHYPS